ncbi:pentapeptide repeat-containing protein [Streptomyces sp. NPDC088762]|uniref:pentapeptide repeat-containing protein n=1 Tax=Streptomyces sp. NPDC088762 TaxID=3365891 RepID=UPI0038176073
MSAVILHPLPQVKAEARGWGNDPDQRITAAVSVLTSRDSDNDGTTRVDLHEGDLHKVSVMLRGDLSRANLNRTDLRGANLSDACLRRANLAGADLGAANLNCEFVAEKDLRGVLHEPERKPPGDCPPPGSQPQARPSHHRRY